MKLLTLVAACAGLAIAACSSAPPTIGGLPVRQPNQADTLDLYDKCKAVGSVEPAGEDASVAARALALEANTVQIIAQTLKVESSSSRSGNVQYTTTTRQGQLDVRYWRCP